MNDQIQLLQFIICKDFREEARHDQYQAESVLSNLYAPKFPLSLENLCAVTCWRKDKRFHKEVIEYETSDGSKHKSPPMDIEPITSHVLFRWHKHIFPGTLTLAEPTILTIRVILDWEIKFQTYIMIEKPLS